MAIGIDMEAASEREIVVARTIEGSRQRVFQAYTDVKHLAHRWGPNGFTTTTHRFAFRPGGTWEFIMHGPDGIDYPNWIEFRAIVPPERIVYVHGERRQSPRR